MRYDFHRISSSESVKVQSEVNSSWDGSISSPIAIVKLTPPLPVPSQEKKEEGKKIQKSKKGGR